jgi:hypothetical protein
MRPALKVRQTDRQTKRQKESERERKRERRRERGVFIDNQEVTEGHNALPGNTAFCGRISNTTCSA